MTTSVNFQRYNSVTWKHRLLGFPTQWILRLNGTFESSFPKSPTRGVEDGLRRENPNKNTGNDYPGIYY